MPTQFPPAAPGTKLAGFDVIAEIGRGAASIIYLASEPKTRQVWALKHVQKNEPKDQRFIDQAQAEYEIAQKVKNPRVRHIDRVIKGRAKLIQLKELFLVMEYVDGLSVEQRPPETFRDALRIFHQTAEGLSYMHQAGYVHADMKPNNVVIQGDGNVKVIDLGKACKIGTVKERIQGTPDYIAPEQVHRREITPKTDIYNLGGTMYWILTGKNIPTALTKEGTDSLLDGLDENMIEAPTPACELNKRVPIDLSDLIDRCVKPRVDERPDSIAEVLEVLDEIIEDEDEAAGEQEERAAI